MRSFSPEILCAVKTSWTRSHSSDFLQGVTAAKGAAGNVSIVRLTRSPAGNHIAQVPTKTVKELYDDPLIQYYRILDGLFYYHGVLLGEADSDCTYYRAVLDSAKELDDGTPTESLNIHYAHCGGKARIRKAVSALRSASVPFACVVDMDILQNEIEFEELVKACGGDPENFRPLRNDVVSLVNNKTTKPSRVAVKAEVLAVLDGKVAAELSSSEIAKIQKAVSAASGWKQAKQQGRSCLSGQAVGSFDKLNAQLREIGIFIVEVGELERFHPEVPAANKAEWLRQVLEDKKYQSAPEAQKLMKSIATGIIAQQRAHRVLGDT